MTDESVMCGGNIARTLRDIPAPVLVGVVMPIVLIACQEVYKAMLRGKSTNMGPASIVTLRWTAAIHSTSKVCHPHLILYYWISPLAPVSKTDSCVCWRKQECLRGKLQMDRNGI